MSNYKNVKFIFGAVVMVVVIILLYVSIERGKKIGELRGEKIGEARGKKIGEARIYKYLLEKSNTARNIYTAPIEIHESSYIQFTNDFFYTTGCSAAVVVKKGSQSHIHFEKPTILVGRSGTDIYEETPYFINTVDNIIMIQY